MRASILIATHNEGQTLLNTVQSCVETTQDLDCEIVVADDASTDGSVDDLKQKFPEVRVVANLERTGTSPTKNLAAQSAQTPILVFLDAHCKPEPGAIEAMVQDVEETDGNALVIPQVVGLDCDRWQLIRGQIGYGYRVNLLRFEAVWIGLEQMEQAGRFFQSPNFVGCCLGITKNLYEKLKGFDADMLVWGIEDVDFGLKAWLMGHPILHDSNIVIGHRFQSQFNRYTVPMEHVIKNQLRMARKNFTEPVWYQWIQRCRAFQTESLWAIAWDLFEETRESLESEREYLMKHRIHDEFWYASQFNLTWPLTEMKDRMTSIMKNKPSESLDSPESDNQRPDESPKSYRERQFSQYQQTLWREHYEFPYNEGSLTGKKLSGSKESEDGTQVKLDLKLTRWSSGQIEIVKTAFQVDGNRQIVPFASLLAMLLESIHLDRIDEFEPEILLRALGCEGDKRQHACVVIGALHEAIENL